MQISPRKLNFFLLLKLPAAYFTGVRATYLDATRCTVKVKHRWINQNPFKSMFWAVQGMAAELTTGALMMQKIRQSKRPISMLVANNSATFLKKATGRITFQCHDGEKIDAILAKALETGEGQTIWLEADGVNEQGETVSQFKFEWTVKLKG